MTIPAARKSEKYPFDDLEEVGQYFVSDVFTRKHMKYMGAVVAYYNKTRDPKHFVQRHVDGDNRIYRDK